MKCNRGLLFLLSTFLILLSLKVSAQIVTDMPEPRMQSTAVPPPPGLPVDGGISALLAAGLGLGIYFFRNRN